MLPSPASAPADPILERDLFRALLELSAQEALEPLLDAALDLALRCAGAEQGWLELWGADADGPRWRRGRGLALDEAGGAPRGVIAEVRSRAQTVQTASALEDPRFQDRKSVQERAIQAVLCAPIGRPALGVVYLQGRRRPGPFSEDDVARTELFARQLAPLVDRLLLRLAREEGLDPTLPWRQRLGEVPLVGRSRAMAELLRQICLVAPLALDVLITGPTGSGKSAVAELIARSGPRAREPFVALNCAALPSELLESELFGAERGAHSTATRPVQGKVAAAEGGTLFLDEVGELPLAAQAKLLQLLQERIYWPLGASRARRADIRVIAATNADLEEAVRARRLREDLYYRLSVYPIRCPGLDERRADLPLLAERFCRDACERHHLPRLALSEAALVAISEAAWPGNVRQLQHAVERAVVRAWGEGAARVGPEHVFPGAQPAEEPAPLDLHEATRRLQRRLVAEALDASGGNASEAARRLGLSRSHLYTLMRGLGLR